MPGREPELECSAEDKASLVAITKSRIEEARAVERARIVLACPDGKEIQQVAWELGVSIPTVTKMKETIEAICELNHVLLPPIPQSGNPGVRSAPLSFARLVAEEVADLWDDCMQPADQVLDDDALLMRVPSTD